LRADLHRTSAAVPCWSPTGEWIAYNDRGYKLISPDGAKTRDLGDIKAVAISFSTDGKLLYGIRVEGDRCPLFSVDIASGAEKVIGDVGLDKIPRSPLNPAMRLSLSPDGKSVVYGTASSKINMWMLEGFVAKRGWW
jgi:Tol biopolymer transport system component